MLIFFTSNEVAKNNTLMKAAVIADPIEVSDHLSKLGFTKDQLLEVVHAAVSARNGCTLNDPPGSAGWSSWQQGTRRLREIGIQMGMERDDTEQIACVYNAKCNVKIAVANTDDGTGIPDRQPLNRSKKGSATDRLIQSNQGTFVDILDQAMNVISLLGPQEDKSVLWYLCIYAEGDLVRAELSCPTLSEGGYFKEFSERIIIVGPDDHDDYVKRRFSDDDGGAGEEFDISVTRKLS